MTLEDVYAISEAIGYLRGMSLNQDYVLGEKTPLWYLADKLENIIKAELTDQEEER